MSDELEGIDIFAEFGIGTGDADAGGADAAAEGDGSAVQPATEGEGEASAQGSAQAGTETGAEAEGEGEGANGTQTQASAEDPEKELMRRQIEALTRAQGAPAPTAAAAPASNGAEIPPYQFNIPNELAALMYSEDPQERLQGLALYGQGVAQAVHRQVLETAGTQMQQYVGQAIAAHAEAQRVRQDFYGKFPEFDKPELHQTVLYIASQLARETGAAGWSSQLRDAVGARMKALFPAVAPAQPPKPPKTPASGRSGGSGNGRAAAGGKKSIGDQIHDML